METVPLLARDLMSTEVVTVPAEMPVAALARLLAERGISAVPVIDAAGSLLGIVTEADLLRQLAAGEDAPKGWLGALFGNTARQAEQYAKTHGRAAQDVMTGQLVTVEPDATVEHCAHLMEERRIKRLPVVRDGQLMGIISRADLVRAALQPPGRIGSAAETEDSRIRATLHKEMREQPWANSLYTFADVKDGVVTLHGFARSAEVRRGLRVLAGRIAGVRQVEDRLEDAPMVLPGEIV